MIRALAVAGAAFAAPGAAGAFLLNPPIDCALGEVCFIQQYVDRDPGPGAADFTCGPLSYDGHEGTDFALPSLAMMRAGVDVLAAAPGTVVALRDGMPDISSTDPAAPGLDGRDCGNGVRIRHGGGWETQYCHMKQGSIAVTTGQRVAKGAILGEVGLSGRTEYPHVELTVRRDGAVVDPFDPAPGPPICGRPAQGALWQMPLSYAPGGLIDAGIATGVPDYAEVREGPATPGVIAADAPAIVLWAYAFGGRAGDEVVITLTGPGGELLRNVSRLERGQAQFYRAAGKRRGAGAAAWPAGEYSGQATLLRDGAALDRRRLSFRVGG